MHSNSNPHGSPLEGSELWSYFSLFADQSTQIKFACAGVSIVCKAIFQLTMSCCVLEIFATKLRSFPKLCGNFDVLGAAKFRGKKPTKFLTEFYKSWSWLNMWQSLETTGQATSEI